MLAKVVFYATLLAVYALRRAAHPRRARELCFYPQIPDAEYMAWKVCAFLGLKRRLLHPSAKIVFVFDDDDYGPQPRSGLPSPAALTLDVAINLHCSDISKSTVTRVGEQVFGYSLGLDPMNHEGPIVEKSNANARHDGRVLDAPIARVDPERVYQRLVDNEHQPGLIEDIRVPVVGESVPLVYLKYRRVENRFTNENEFVLLKKCEDVLSPEEVARILEVCRRIGLDCGELDLVRDRTTSTLYILDANKTCWGPPNRLRLLDRYRAVRRLAQTFDSTFLASTT